MDGHCSRQRNMLAIFVTALVTLATELILIRVFDVILFRVFAYIIITCAMFAFGAAGVFLAILNPAPDQPSTQRRLLVYAVTAALLLACVRPAVNLSGLNLAEAAQHPITVFGQMLFIYGVLVLTFFFLGLIIVDEEHESAYKQEDGVSYHARDMAVVRGRIENAPVVLASATPSLETRVNAERGRYVHLKLPERFGGRELPQLGLVDLRRDKPERGRWLSGALIKAVEANLEAKEQSLLFLNRRGYAPLTLCRDCGHRFQCPNCSAWLVDHRFRRALVCHHCGHVERRPHECPACHQPESLIACGPGVERLAEEVATLFPQARSIVLSSDFPGGTERLKQELMAVAGGEFDIVIGTQLVAKGHNFPGMTLVGVIDADLGLTSGDPRAAERTFQALRQVTGRAGRGEKPGRALLQTHDPEHPVLKALISSDPERFYAAEEASREAAGLPPFGRLAALIVSANSQAEAESHARALARSAEASDGIMVLGPAEAPLAVLRGRHRMRLIVKTAREINLQDYLRGWLKRTPRPKGSVRVAVDVDPQSFL